MDIFLANHLVKYYERKGVLPHALIKVNVGKAFDIVSWQFLHSVLIALGFPLQFIQLVMACVTTPRCAVNINGELKGFFTGERWLTQGDPLCPYLLCCVWKCWGVGWV